MAKPWEKYQQPTQGRPWERYAAPKADFSGVTSSVQSTEELARNPANDSAFARMISGGPSAPRQSLFRNDSDFYERSGISRLSPRMAWAALKDTFGSTQGAAEYLAEQTRGTVTQAQDGSPVLQLRDGTSYRLNDEGLDTADIAKVASNVGAFFVPASAVARVSQARNAGLAGRALGQGVAAAGTDAALQAGFDNGRVDPLRTAAAGLGGVGGEIAGSGLSALARRVRTPSTESMRVAREAAPNAVDFGAVAREVDAGANPAAIAGQQQYGLTYTQGQRMLDPKLQFQQLSREEILRQNPVAGQVFRDQTARNSQALESTLGDMSAQFGGRAGATPAEMAQGAASRLGQQADDLSGRVSEAYQEAGEGMRTAVSRDAALALPDRLKRSVAEFAPNAQLTPATAKTLRQVKLAADDIFGRSGEKSNVAGITLKALETQRRIINNNIAAAANPADRKAMMALKGEFDSWLDESIDGALVSGDQKALEALKNARGLRAEYGRRFEGKGDSDKFIAGLLDGSKTPEELVNIALGASQVSKAGGARFIERLRTAANNDPGVIGNLRAAHFLRMTRGANGEPLNMGQIVRNIRSTEYNNASVVKALYSPQEWAKVKKLAAALEPLVPKGDFAKTSGTAERMARMLFQRVGNVPVLGWGTKFVGDTVAQFRADRALNAPLKLPLVPRPSVTAAGTEAAKRYAD
ncbi:hypothetical protein M8R20_26335 [Pseudomonas sp. R2.Fl]|nr:hypothetical protein [Pseudomonas sp. R2.Fl]MCL6710462.1 hypothetical protein [Pseudomonas sp. R2.Fl]MCL6710522.1 hypothetical protein [Pseudomonas sp. R2.Fl]